MSAPHPLIAVRTDVVMSVLVESLLAAAEARAVAPPRAAEEALGRAGETVARASAPPLTDLARLGWHVRHCELERFEVARDRPPPDLEAALRDGSWPEVVETCLRLAGGEPLERPEPDDLAAVSCRVPGPGGHVRHYVALRAVGSRGAAVALVRAGGTSAVTELKRVWLFGFLLAETGRLRDEAAPGGS